jgi:hypothetical protein
VKQVDRRASRVGAQHAVVFPVLSPKVPLDRSQYFGLVVDT